MESATQTPAFSGLLPHPPIVVADVGGPQLDQCHATVAACEEFADRLVQTAPSRVVLVSPHAPRHQTSFGYYTGRTLRGDLRQFGSPRTAISLPGDPALGDMLGTLAGSVGLSVQPVTATGLDHGAVVPLWFLTAAGWRGPTTVLALPWRSTPTVLRRFGRVLGQAVARLDGAAALVASGDMTHRATPGAPAGYDPAAVEFDQRLTELVRTGRLDAIAVIDARLREIAAEDVVDPSVVVTAALGDVGHGPEVLSYEHPFGVGYMVAVFHDGGQD